MATDVFLSWDGMNDQERRLQSREWDYGSGALGHLRAAVWMERENELLSHLFEERYWSSHDTLGLPYDFEVGMKILGQAEEEYLRSVREGVKPRFGGRTPPVLSQAQAAYAPEDLDLAGAQLWLNSAFDFFKLGVEEQMAGKNPRVYISW